MITSVGGHSGLGELRTSSKDANDASRGCLPANGSGPRIITLDEVQQHSTADDAWLVLDGRVYNITMFLRYHPGGQDILIKRAAGRDATALFNKYHPNVKAHNMLKKCLMGYLQQSDAAVDSSKSGNNVAKAAKSLFARLQL